MVDTQLTRRTFLAGMAGGAAALTLGSCGDLVRYWPPASGSWDSVSPAEAGWDPARLEAAVAFAGERSTQALLIVLDGRILAERRWGVAADFRRDVASCQKSVVALLVGQARSRGLLALGDTVSGHLGPGWSAAAPADEARITVRHLLTMTSGLDDRLRKAAEPGTRWSYNTPAYHVLQLVLEEVTGTGIDPLSRLWLWAPIGATHSSWYVRPGPGDALGRPQWGLLMPARDMVRFGLMVERLGRWRSATVVDETYLAEALRPSQALNPAYGYLWWLNRQDPPRLFRGAPADLVAAQGRHDQKIYVSRSRRLVVARLGEDGGGRRADGTDFNTGFWTRLMAASP